MANTDLLWNAQSMLTPLTIPTRFSTGQLPAYGVNDAYSPYVMLNHTGMATRETLQKYGDSRSEPGFVISSERIESKSTGRVE